MNHSDQLRSFRIGPRAVAHVFVNDREVQSGVGLPACVFNWRFEGMDRTAIVPPEGAFESLTKWAQHCSELEIEPTLVLAADDDVCTSDELDQLISIGIDLVVAAPPPATSSCSDGAADSGDESVWTLARAIALPDEPVVDAYYSTTTTQPLSAWPLHSDLRFWVAYGLALTKWRRAGGYRLWECLDLYFRQRPSSETLKLAHTASRATSDPEFLDDNFVSEGLSGVQQANSVLKLPFTFDVLRHGRWESYGRLPGLDLALYRERLAVADELPWAELLRQLPSAFLKSLTSHRDELVNSNRTASAPDLMTWFDLVVVASTHPDFPVSAAATPIGAVGVSPSTWQLRVPKVPLLSDERSCVVSFEGLWALDADRPVTRLAQLAAAGPDDWPFGQIDVTVEGRACRAAPDADSAARFSLELDGHVAHCSVRPS
jgi:hypothetical protein